MHNLFSPRTWVELLVGKGGMAFAGATLGLALAIMTAHIFSRYVFDLSIFWAEEMARYLLLWSALVGTAVAYREYEHIGLTYLLNRFPGKIRAFLWSLIHLITLSFGVLVTTEGWVLAMRNLERQQLSPALQWPIGWIYLAIPVGGALWSLAAVEALLYRRVPEAMPGEGPEGRGIGV